MTILWVDGFDHYNTGATGRTNMLQGPYAEIESGVQPTAGNARTGTASLKNTSTSAVSRTLFRRVFGADKTTAGVGFALYLPNLPGANGDFDLIQFRDSNNAVQCSVALNSTGTISLMRGDGDSGTVLATSASVVIVSGAYQHVEAKATIDDSAGSMEVRVNGVTAVTVSGVDTKNTAIAGTAQFAVRFPSSQASTMLCEFEDIFAWDTSGSNNNDFIGDLKVRMQLVNGDTAVSDWTRNTGANDYEAIDDTAPDSDTTYIEATTVNAVSEFDFTDLPSGVGSIKCVQLTSMMRKTDAGDGSVRQSIVTGGSPESVAAGASNAMTTVYTYYQDVVETDPSTGALWTKSALDAAKLRLTRTL